MDMIRIIGLVVYKAWMVNAKERTINAALATIGWYSIPETHQVKPGYKANNKPAQNPACL